MTIHPPATGELRLALDDIRLRDNVRDLDEAHVDNLAQSIALRGLLVPLIVRPVDGGYELVAGYHRFAACRQLDLPDAPVVVRDQEGSSADSAAENVTRKQLSPLDEARAVQAMLDEGYTLDGAAQALGWSRQLVSARAKILKLPEIGQQLVGSGAIPVGAIDALLGIADVSPPIAEALAQSVADGTVAGSQVAGNTGWAIGQALRDCEKDTFGAYMTTIYHGDLKALRLGKKADALVAEGEKLHRQIDQYAYGPPTFRFASADVDQARAAGVLIEFDGGAPIITDRALYRELAKQVIARTVEELRGRAAAKAHGTRNASVKRERTPREALDAEHRATLRELTRQAHGTNLDLGAALLTELATVAPDDIDVARFFVLCRHPHKANYADGVTMPTRISGGLRRARRQRSLGLTAAGAVGMIPASDSVSAPRSGHQAGLHSVLGSLLRSSLRTFSGSASRSSRTACAGLSVSRMSPSRMCSVPMTLWPRTSASRSASS